MIPDAEETLAEIRRSVDHMKCELDRLDALASALYVQAVALDKHGKQ